MQTAPEGSLWSGFTLLAIPEVSFTHLISWSNEPAQKQATP